MLSFPLKSILIVDDDEISNLFNKIFIKKLDLDVNLHIVQDGQEALNLLKMTLEDHSTSLLPCMLLLDIKMPVMDGWNFLDAFDELFDQALKDKFVIIMLTTSENEGDMIKAMNNPNISEFIQKPLSEKKLQKFITAYFAASESR